MGVVFLNPADAVNKTVFIVLAPAYTAPVSEYDAMFNTRPIFTPDSPHLLRSTATTVNEMINWYFTKTPFKFQNDKDILSVYEILTVYLESMDKVAEDQLAKNQQFYLNKARAFHNFMTNEIDRLNYYHRVKQTNRFSPKSLIDIVSNMIKPKKDGQ